MKNLYAVVALYLWSIPLFCEAQVDEIGLYFERSGFIQEINPEKQYLVINFPTVEEISEEVVYLVDPKTNLSAKGISEINKFRIGMEVILEGDKYPKRGITVAKNISIKNDKKKIKIDKGRLDDVNNEYAVVDGHKVKLKDGEKILGDKKSLYKNKIFNSFKELKLGDFVNLEGVWDDRGFILANDIYTSPDLETIEDIRVKNVGKQTLYNFIVNDWLDPQKRLKLLGQSFGDTKIVNSSVLQSYIQNFGTRLVPDHLKEKFRFVFMVVDDKEWNASAQADGLVRVNTGFLDTMPNEAQLAAVLGHEITHTIYEHIANSQADNKQLNKESNSNQRVVNSSSTLAKNFIDWAKLPPVTYSIVSKYKLKQDVDSVAKALSSLQKAKRSYNESLYNIEQEAQSDRVGLYWTAKVGYDPREAMKVWRNRYNRYYHTATEKSGKNLEQFSAFSKEFNRYRKPPSVTDIGIHFFKNTLKNRAAVLTDEAFYSEGHLKSHPDNIKRFTNLNKYTYMFYSNSEAIKNYRLGENELQKVLSDANAEMTKAAKVLAEKNEREFKKRIELDKAYQKAIARLKTQVTGHQIVLLTFKDFKLFKSLKVKELIGKSKCTVPKLETLWGEVYDKYNTQIESFVNHFKAGEIAPNNRNRDFAIHYSLSRGFNDFTIDLAARYQACDTEYLNAVRATIERDNIKPYIWPNEDTIIAVWEYLESLDQKK